MANPKISLIKSGLRNSWQSDFGAQSWSNVIDYTGGYGGWAAGSNGSPYFPRINYNSNGIIQWQSTTYWYYGYLINHFGYSGLANIVPTILEGTIYGYMGTSYHRQTTSYNLFCNNAGYVADDSYYRNIRATTGLSFAVLSAGGYDGSYTNAHAYLNGNVLNSNAIGTISNCNTDYTLKFKLIGNQLFAGFSAGDLRNTPMNLSLVSNSVPVGGLTGRGMNIFMSSWITNDQGESCYGQVNSISLTNTI